MAREISRQTFLRGAAGAMVAGTIFGSVRATADPIASGWEGLSAAIGGHLILPDNGQFGAAKQVFNTNYNGSRPAAIVTPTSAADVQKAMAFAAANNLRSPRAAAGIPTSVRRLQTARWCSTFDSCPAGSTTTPQPDRSPRPPATSLYDLHQMLAGAGRGIPTGTCPSVGAAGHALGGGLGAQSRHAGLLSDALTSAIGRIAGRADGHGVCRRKPRPVLGVAWRRRRQFRRDDLADLLDVPHLGRRRREPPLSRRSRSRRCSSVGRTGCGPPTE